MFFLIWIGIGMVFPLWIIGWLFELFRDVLTLNWRTLLILVWLVPVIVSQAYIQYNDKPPWGNSPPSTR